jgi:hypothetical protein
MTRNQLTKRPEDTVTKRPRDQMTYDQMTSNPMGNQTTVTVIYPSLNLI